MPNCAGEHLDLSPFPSRFFLFPLRLTALLGLSIFSLPRVGSAILDAVFTCCFLAGFTHTKVLLGLHGDSSSGRKHALDRDAGKTYIAAG